MEFSWPDRSTIHPEQLTAKQVLEKALPLINAIYEKATDRYSRIDLRYKFLRPGAAVALAHILRQLRGITSFDLSYTVPNMCLPEDIETWQTMCGVVPHTLAELNLSNNPLGTRGVQYAMPALLRQVPCIYVSCHSFCTKPQLHTLYLDNAGLGHEAVQLLLSALQPATMKRLELAHNPLGEQGASYLAPFLRAAHQLTHLSLGATQFTAKGSALVVDALVASQATFVRLLLPNTPIGVKTGTTLVEKVLNNQPHLNTLVLDSTGLGEYNVMALVQTLAKNSPHLAILGLAHLDLSANILVPLSALTLKRQEPVARLDIRRNKIEGKAVRLVLGEFNSAWHVDYDDETDEEKEIRCPALAYSKENQDDADALWTAINSSKFLHKAAYPDAMCSRWHTLIRHHPIAGVAILQRMCSIAHDQARTLARSIHDAIPALPVDLCLGCIAYYDSSMLYDFEKRCLRFVWLGKYSSFMAQCLYARSLYEPRRAKLPNEYAIINDYVGWVMYHNVPSANNCGYKSSANYPDKQRPADFVTKDEVTGHPFPLVYIVTKQLTSALSTGNPRRCQRVGCYFYKRCNCFAPFRLL